MESHTDIYRIIDPTFRSLIQPSARLWRRATGFEWTEGPVWFGDHRLLLFSDIPSARIMRLTEEGELSVFRAPSGYSNGNTRDRQGRLVSCQHGTRSVTRTEPDGTVTVIAGGFAGKRLNSPNDVVVQSNGAVWFTDPTYGILSNYEGYQADPEQEQTRVYRADPETGAVQAMIAGFVQPNGLAFAPDESILYVAESGMSHDPSVLPVIRAYDLDATGRPGDPRAFATLDSGFPDGFRVDCLGNVWTSAADGVHCFAPDGRLLGKILVPETVSNLCFGGSRGNRLFITATTSVYSVAVSTEAAVP